MMTVSTLKETAPKHKRVITEKFSLDAEYWRRIYEKSADGEEAFVSHEMWERKNAVLKCIDAYADDRKLLVLDAGCGAGITMRDILQRGHSVVGADSTKAMLDRAKDVVSQFSPNQACCVSGDVEHAPFKDGSFDIAVCMGVLQYLQTDEKALNEISRVVRDDGLVIVTLPNIFKIGNFLDPYYYLIRWVQFVGRKLKRTGTEAFSPSGLDSNAAFANRRYYYGQLSSLFGRNNLAQLHVAAIAFGPLTFWRKPFLPAYLSIKISDFVRRMTLKRHFKFLNPFANRWVICLRKGNSQCRWPR